MQKRVAFKTLGCRLNQLETDSMVTDFSKAGYEIVPFNQKADVYVVNTCTVTNQSDQKSKNTINQAVRHSNKMGAVVVTGCMVSSQKEYLEKRDDLTFVVENGKKYAVLELVESYFKGRTIQPSDFKVDLFNFSVVEKGFHTRSTIKIQDGCNNFCTYCIVPKVRGRANSRPWEQIESNIHRVLDLGYKEIVLTGVNISRYHYDNLHFEDLVEKILDIPGDFRLRISSIEPEGFTDKFIELFDNPKLCPHLHLCLQSGSNSVLKRMGRNYKVSDFQSLMNKFKRKIPDFNFTTDIIVGFPGETEDEFQETCKVINQLGFSHIHTFKYSVRKGTYAEKIPDHIPDKVKAHRSEVIRNLASENKKRFRKLFENKEMTVLVERRDLSKSLVHGYTQNYLPVHISKGKFTANNFYKVLVKNVGLDGEFILNCEIVE